MVKEIMVMMSITEPSRTRARYIVFPSHWKQKMEAALAHSSLLRSFTKGLSGVPRIGVRIGWGMPNISWLAEEM